MAGAVVRPSVTSGPCECPGPAVAMSRVAADSLSWRAGGSATPAR